MVFFEWYEETSNIPNSMCYNNQSCDDSQRISNAVAQFFQSVSISSAYTSSELKEPI